MQTGKPTELVDRLRRRPGGLPSGNHIRQIAALDKILSEAKFVLTQEGSNRLSLEYRAGGVHARKIFDFDPEKYRAVISTELETKRRHRSA